MNWEEVGLKQITPEDGPTPGEDGPRPDCARNRDTWSRRRAYNRLLFRMEVKISLAMEKSRGPKTLPHSNTVYTKRYDIRSDSNSLETVADEASDPSNRTVRHVKSRTRKHGLLRYELFSRRLLRIRELAQTNSHHQSRNDKRTAKDSDHLWHEVN